LIGPTTFTFLSSLGVDPITLEYCLEISSDPGFAKGKTVAFTNDRLFSGSSGVLSIGPIDVSTILTTVTTPLYWRVGVRNPLDNPLPVADPSGQRYIFPQGGFQFTRPGITPPPPPAE
jgi:hypothetical protein